MSESDRPSNCIPTRKKFGAFFSELALETSGKRRLEISWQTPQGGTAAGKILMMNLPELELLNANVGLRIRTANGK